MIVEPIQQEFLGNMNKDMIHYIAENGRLLLQYQLPDGTNHVIDITSIYIPFPEMREQLLIKMKLQLGSNVRLISFIEAVKRLNSEAFTNFNFLPEHQVVPHNPKNYIATFYGKDSNIYLVELQYNQSTNQIFPPV